MGFVVTDGNRFLDDLHRRDIDPEAEAAIAEVLRQRPLYWEETKSLRDALGLSNLDISAMIVKNGWHWRTEPYMITIPDHPC